MAEPHVIATLVKRRSDIAGEIEHSQRRTRKLLEDLEHLDATIRQFDPDYKLEEIRAKGFRPPSDWANRGEMSRIVLGMLRQASEPMTTRDIALAIMKRRGLNTADDKMVRKMTKRAGVALRAQRNNGLIRSQNGHGLYMMWTM